jgi:hypothetical protein
MYLLWKSESWYPGIGALRFHPNICHSGKKGNCAMNEKEKMESYIATCQCCLLAQAMKNCPSCRFNIGLAEQVKVKPVDSIPLSTQAQIAIFAMSE